MLNSPAIKTTNLLLGRNMLDDERKVGILPLLTTGGFVADEDQVELLLVGKGNYSIESPDRPIKFDRFFGNRIIFNTMQDPYNINPKFIFYNNTWILYNAGYVCFAEQEIEYKPVHRLWGENG